MKGLKLLVALLGLMILAMMTVVGYGLYRKASDPDFRFFDLGGGAGTVSTPVQATPPQPPLATPGTATTNMAAPMIRDLGLAPGTDVRQITAADGRLYIHVRLQSGLDQVLILDGRDGRVLGTVNINR